MDWNNTSKCTITFGDGRQVVVETEFEFLSVRAGQTLRGLVDGPVAHVVITADDGTSGIFGLGDPITKSDSLSRAIILISSLLETYPGKGKIEIYGSDYGKRIEIKSIVTEGRRTAAPEESGDAPVGSGSRIASVSPVSAAGMRVAF